MYNNLQNFTRLESKVTPKNDIVFKRIFGAKGNEEILKDFLEAILNIKIDRCYNRVCARLQEW